MAVLSTEARIEIKDIFMRELSSDNEGCSTRKADLQAAFNAIDDYFVANALAINASIPQPARGSLTMRQKARVLLHVVRRRYLDNA